MAIEDWTKELLLDQAGNVLYGVANSMDEYLLDFFGSKENAERYGHLYILEQHPYQFETQLDSKDNIMRITAHTTYRLRFKTKEELRQEQEGRDKHNAYNESEK